jgi:hypothetical protein
MGRAAVGQSYCSSWKSPRRLFWTWKFSFMIETWQIYAVVLLVDSRLSSFFALKFSFEGHFGF